MFRRIALTTTRQIRFVPTPIRSLSTTRITRNDIKGGFSPDQVEKIQNSDAYKKLMSDPELMEKFTDIAEYLQNNNLVQPGQPPSVFQIGKILTQREARDKLTAFAEAAQKAGIDFKSEEFTEMIKNMK